MTIIAWDGKRLAADSLMTTGTTRAGMQDKVKLARFEDKAVLYASTGAAGWLDEWIAWDIQGAKASERPWTALAPHYTGVIIRVMDGACHMLTPEHPYWLPCEPGDAWGSGADFAIGAMEAGYDAMNATTVAVRRDTGCGGAITVWYAEHPDYTTEPHERCACPSCFEHFTRGTQPEPEQGALERVVRNFDLSAYLRPDGGLRPEMVREAAKMMEMASCLGSAEKACGSGLQQLGEGLYAHVVYSDLMGGERVEHKHDMSQVYFDLTKSGDGVPFDELCTGKYATVDGATDMLRDKLREYFAAHPGDVHWRVKPEIISQARFDDGPTFEGYARLVCIAPDAIQRTQQWFEIPLNRKVVVTEHNDELFAKAVAEREARIVDRYKAAKAGQEVIARVRDTAAAIRQHMETMTDRVEEKAKAFAAQQRALHGDKVCEHGYVPKTCSTCTPQLAVASRPNGRMHEAERQGDSGLPRNDGPARPGA
jgi:hypothetical protein